MLELLEIEPRDAATRAVIWLHGLGADGNDFAPLIKQWGLAELLNTRFVLPHAPRRPVTLNGGMLMRAWYDLYNLDFGGDEDEEGIRRAEQQLLALVQRENDRGIDNSQIILAGFSQGGAVALHTALRMAAPPAAVLVLSTYLPLAGRLHAEKRAAADSLYIRMDHGEMDPVVPFQTAEKSRNLLQAEGYFVEFQSYAMQHSLCIEQAESLCEWFARRLG